MTVIDYIGRVKRGAALLDERVPGWADRINTDTLDISHGMRCVTAQVSGGSWRNGMYLLGLEWDGYIEHGFHVRFSDHETEQETDCMFDLLRDYWYDEITTRTDAVSAPLAAEQTAI